MMMNKQRILALIGGIAISCLFTLAQKSENNLWTSGVVKLKVNKQLRFDLEEQTRFDKDITRLHAVITEGGALYELNKHFSVKANFRYIYDQNAQNSYRYSGDFAYDWSKKKFPLNVKYRLRFQRTIEEHTHAAESYFRNKLTAGYNLTKIVDPYIGFESYFKLNYINKFTTNRYIAGLEWKITKKIDLTTYFMLEDEFGERKPKIQRIFGVELAYGFKL